MKNSMRIECTEPDTKVYVFEGSIVQMEIFRNIMTLSAAGCLLAVFMMYMILYWRQKWQKEHFTEQ